MKFGVHHSQTGEDKEMKCVLIEGDGVVTLALVDEKRDRKWAVCTLSGDGLERHPGCAPLGVADLTDAERRVKLNE